MTSVSEVTLIKCMECLNYAQVTEGECPHCGSDKIRNIENDMEVTQ